MDVPGNKAIREFMDKLTSSTNVSKYVELPMIAVMGDTSSGKSSLLSSISLVELPSSSKLTTRCPIMLRMTKDEKRHATVDVKWRQKPEGTDQNVNFDTKEVDDDHWGQLPDAIAEAQEHIIKCTGKEVARDIVNVSVYDPDCHDLTLIDLPGIVRSRGENESASIVEDIDSLIQDYLSNQRCVILAVVPANVDFHNSQIMADAQEVDPETNRTIPVITKPDLIDAGGETDVVDLLCGKKIKFDLGFHMVKGRGQAALDKKQTIKKGLEDEMSFFENTKPWRDLEDRSFLGTSNLRVKLGNLQMKMIQEQIPNIVNDMKKQKLAAEEELIQMGTIHSTPTERNMFFREKVHALLETLKSHVTGEGYHGKNSPSSAQLHVMSMEFRGGIMKGRLHNITTIDNGTPVIYLTGGEPTRFVSTDVTKTQVHGSLGIFPIDRCHRDPKWLEEMIKSRRTDGLPCFPNSCVFVSIVETYISEDWKPQCEELLNKAHTIVCDAINDSIASIGCAKRYKSLDTMMQQRALKQADSLLAREKGRLEHFLEDEKNPYTQNHYLFENLSKKRTEKIRQEILLMINCNQQIAKSTVEAIFSRNEKKSIEEHAAEDMEAVLDAYGKVAAKRVIDKVPMFCRRIFSDVCDAIRRSFDQVTDAELESFMQDCLSFRQRHKELTLKVAEMEKGLEISNDIF